MTESVALQLRSEACGDEIRATVGSFSATGGRKTKTADFGITSAPAVPAQTGLRNAYYANQYRYQFPDVKWEPISRGLPRCPFCDLQHNH